MLLPNLSDYLPLQVKIGPEWEREKVAQVAHAAREAKLFGPKEDNILHLSDIKVSDEHPVSLR